MHHKPPLSRQTRRPVLPRLPVCLCIFVALLPISCKQLSKLTGPDKKSDLLEAELRTRERELLEARQELAQLRPYQQYQDIPPAVPSYPPAFPVQLTGRPAGGITLREVVLGTGTGGRDDDGISGDELLQVVITPKDDDGTAVKVPGSVQVAAFEVTQEGFKVPIGKWEVAPEQLRKTWRSGLIGSGYFVPLTWDRLPTRDRIRVVIRMQTSDGRTFEADKDVRVVPMSHAPSAPHSPTIPPGFQPTYPEMVPQPRAIPQGTTELPAPRVVSPTAPAPPTILPPPMMQSSFKPDAAAQLLPATPR